LSFVKSNNGPKTVLHILMVTIIFLFVVRLGLAADSDSVTIIDSRHYSHVLAEIRNYRIFLPPGYFDHPDRRYPVIYFFHGWSQRYFGSSNPYGDFDKGDDNGGDNIANFVEGHEVIVVKADGYNRSPDEPYYVRPWNVSPVETYRQFPLYFPELVEHIDALYRTLADRRHRGISGLSMGGFMTFWIGGKYPHLVSAAGNFCGSAEFTVGPKDFPVEYRHLDMYNNYGGMNVRLHYGDKDFIRGYHEDLNRVWPQVMDNYDYQVYDAAHSTCGMSDMFSYILQTFENPPARPEKWSHIDVYPEFSVWDYQVMTDRTVPGFTILDKVDERGFRCAVREFLPDGELLSSVRVTIRTPPVYENDQWYTINDIDIRTLETIRKTLRSDNQGRLTIELNGSIHEIGINKSTDLPNLSLLTAGVEGMPWATHGKEVQLSLKVLNKGLATGRNIRASLSATRPGTTVKVGKVPFAEIGINEIRQADKALIFEVEADSMEVVQFKLTLQDDQNNIWEEFFEIPLKKDLPEIRDFEIADGKIITVAKSGIDTETVLLGKGNGDGIANPGESIVILIRDQDKWWRTALTYSDPYINPHGIRMRQSDNWTSFDHVGGSAKYDIPLISSDCPENHLLDFFTEYWLPEYPLHIIRQGIVKVRVKGADTTPPVIGRIEVTGDNLLQVKMYDGTDIGRVKAILIEENDPKKRMEIALTDDGQNGDRQPMDLLFSQKIPNQVFGIFRVVIEAEDAFGNKTVEEAEEHFVLH
jgi:S-formylglutathione hydrolase FrmB